MANPFNEDDMCGGNITFQFLQMSISGITIIVVVILFILGTRKFIQTKRDEVNIPFIFKYIFYSCIIMAIMQCLFFILNITICLHIAILSSFMIYGVIIIHLFLLWLFRLYNTFNKSVYAKSNRFFFMTTTAFTTFILFAISGLILFFFNFYFSGAILIILSAFGYMFISIWLMTVFARQLLQLITCQIATMRFTTEQTLHRKSCELELSMRDQQLVRLISKYFVLGICSLSFTLLILFIALLDIIGVFGFGSMQNGIVNLLNILSMIDVMSNIWCMYLQFNFANKTYMKLCKWFDSRINFKVESIAVNLLRKRTFTFYATKLDTPSDNEHNNNNDGDQDNPDKIPTFSSEMIRIQTVKSGSPTSKEETNDMNETKPVLDFDKLINVKNLRQPTQSYDDESMSSIHGDDKDNNEKMKNNIPQFTAVRSESITTKN